MAFQIPEHLIIKETKHWIVNHRIDSNLPGYLMVGAKKETTNLYDLEPEALKEMGVLLSAAQKALTEKLGAAHVYIARYGHTAGPSIHFHVIPIYAWVEEAFAADARYRVLRSFYTPGVETSDPDGGELTLFVWREFCESKTPPAIKGPSVDEVLPILRKALNQA